MGAIPDGTDFFSANCLKEVDAALANSKPLILVHEGDVKKGGALLGSLRADSESKRRSAVFDKGGEVIPWHRVAAFQLFTLKMIVVRVLHCMPSYASEQQPPKIYIPGEIESQALEFQQDIRLYASNFNPGAAGMIAELLRQYHSNKVNVIQEPPPHLQHQSHKPRLLSRGKSTLVRFSHKGPDGLMGLTHMLLYLNSDTFVGDTGQRLFHEVKNARALGIDVLLVHENSHACGGCPFEMIFQTTPEELVADGLYNKLAVACHPEPHRTVSLALIAKELGAMPKRSRVVTAIKSSANKSSHLVTRLPMSRSTFVLPRPSTSESV